MTAKTNEKWVLVTGAAGFIGSHLTDLLLERGEKVIGVDKFVTGVRKNIAHLKENKNFRFIEHDITQPLKVKEPLKWIFNFASPASPVDFPTKPIDILMVGSYGVRNMLDLALEKKARFLQASTSEVYGDPLEHPQKESYWGNVNPIGARSCYDESKRFAEALIMAYNRVHKLETRIVRIFNTYGTRMRADDGRVITNFITQALANKPITIYGNGQQTRSFCYVTDLIDGIYRAMNSDSHTPINIGNPTEYTIIQLAEVVKKLTDSKSELVFKPLPENDPIKRKPDISKARQLLGWEPVVQLEEGVNKTIAFFTK